MKRFILYFFLFIGFLSNAQTLKPVAQKISEYHQKNFIFQKFNLFETRSSPNSEKLKKLAKDATVLAVKKSQIQKILVLKPETIEFSFPYNNSIITVELYKHQLLTSDFSATDNKGNKIEYTPGVYYQGIVKGNPSSLVAFSFFRDNIIGIASISGKGNITIGKTKTTQEYISYSDYSLTTNNPFVCMTDELPENINKQNTASSLIPQSVQSMSNNCVRIYYEVGYQPYLNNGSNTTTTLDWLTGVQNNIATLYTNDEIKIALSEVFIWEEQDPYLGDYSSNLAQFRSTRTIFNGDLAHFVNAPATTSVAYLDSLCSSMRYAYSGISQYYEEVPTYSWTIEAMTHEMGHALGSPHTHACAWNGNNTAIDGCGAEAGYSEGCTGPIPENGGTIMSYCHLIGGVGINLNNGFGEQPKTLIKNNIDSKPCLGNDCINSCIPTVLGIEVTNTTQNSATVNILDNISSNWDYNFYPFGSTNYYQDTTSPILTFNNLNPNSYYVLDLSNNCDNGYVNNNYSQIILTDADWCGGAIFADTGGISGNYGNNQYIVKTFYPESDGQALNLTFSQFGLEYGYDFMNIYDGTSIESPLFENGSELTGNNLIQSSFTSTDPSGAITVEFYSDQYLNDIGWKATFSCSSLGLEDINNAANFLSVYPNPANDKITVDSKDVMQSIEVYDVTGKSLIKFNKLNTNNYQLNISTLIKGDYIMSVTLENGKKISKKIIKK